MNFDYKVENGEVTITGVIDDSLLPSITPFLIDSYPVTKIDININRYVRYDDIVYKLFNNVCADYVVKSGRCYYILNNKRYNSDFTIFYPNSNGRIYPSVFTNDFFKLKYNFV